MSNDIRDQHLIETYKALMPLSAAALKTVLLLNGGAAVALLAFLEKAAAEHLDMRRPMTIFVLGVVLAAVAHVGAYLTQLALYNESLPGANTPRWRRHGNFLWSSVLVVVLSIVAFCWGALSAVHRFHP